MYKIAIKSNGTKEMGAKIKKYLEFLGGKKSPYNCIATKYYYYLLDDFGINGSIFLPSDYTEIQLPNVIFQDEMGNDVYDYLCPVWVVHIDTLKFVTQSPHQFYMSCHRYDYHKYFIHKADADAFIEKNKPTQEKTFPREMFVSDDVNFDEKFKKIVWAYNPMLKSPYRAYDGIESINEIREGRMSSSAWKYAKELDELEATITMFEALEICAKAKNVDKIKII